MKIAIIGSGPAGAYSAYLAKKAGHTVTVFERDPHIGGRTYSLRQDGYAIDAGAAFITSFYSRVFDLAAELDLKSNLVPARAPNALSRNGQLTKLKLTSIGSFARFPLIGIFDKIRLGLWAANTAKKRSQYDLSDPRTLVVDDVEDVETFGRRKLGKRTTDIILRSSIEPFWFFDLKDCSLALLTALSSHAAGARIYLVDGGIDQIASQLLKDVDVRLNTPVDKVRIRGQRAEVEIAGKSTEFDRVVVAATASVASSLIDDGQRTSFPAKLIEFVDQREYAANLHAVFRIEGKRLVEGVRAVFPADDGKRGLGSVSLMRATGDSGSNENEQVISVSASDWKSRELFKLDQESQFGAMWQLARELIPVLPEQAKPMAVFCWDEAIPMQRPGHYTAASEAIAAQQDALLPVRFCGDYFTLPWIEGAMSSAEFALPDL